MLLSIASDASTPLWKKVIFVILVLAATFLLYLGRTREQHRFLIAVLLAAIVVVFVLVMYVFH
jgi:hypothetical protein